MITQVYLAQFLKFPDVFPGIVVLDYFGQHLPDVDWDRDADQDHHAEHQHRRLAFVHYRLVNLDPGRDGRDSDHYAADQARVEFDSSVQYIQHGGTCVAQEGQEHRSGRGHERTHADLEQVDTEEG